MKPYSQRIITILIMRPSRSIVAGPWPARIFKRGRFAQEHEDIQALLIRNKDFSREWLYDSMMTFMPEKESKIVKEGVETGFTVRCDGRPFNAEHSIPTEEAYINLGYRDWICEISDVT